MGVRKAKHLSRCTVKQCGIQRVQRALVTSIFYVTEHTVCRHFHRLLNDVFEIRLALHSICELIFYELFRRPHIRTDRQTDTTCSFNEVHEKIKYP